MADLFELDTAGAFYKTLDSGERTWEATLGGGLFTLPVAHDSFGYTDNDVMYFGFIPNRNPSTSEGEAKIYPPVDCSIRMASITWYSGNAITNENISIYIRVNGTTDYLIATIGSTDLIKIFSNTAMEINMVVGDYFEIKVVCPAWSDPGGTIDVSGVVFAVF